MLDIFNLSNENPFCRDFDINNHVLMGQSTFKGRPITESNIQDYVSSEIVSKYMPHDYPPWQIYIIPVMPSFSSATEDDFCHNVSIADETYG
jgi:hypothetical protein